MTKGRDKIRPLLKGKQWNNRWLLSNCGIPCGVYTRRSQAIASAVSRANKPWAMCRDYFEVRKVHIVEGWK